jgi:hypothetical protein
MKTNRTFIPVSIATNSDHRRGNQIEQARQQIQAASFYLQSLFNSIKHVASHLEAEVDEQSQETCCDLQSIAEIGYAVSNSIFAAVSEIETAMGEMNQNQQPLESVGSEPETGVIAALDEADTDTLALALSEVLRNENLPTDIYIALQNALNDAYNGGIPQAIRDYESSPEYLKVILDACRKNDDETDE